MTNCIRCISAIKSNAQIELRQKVKNYSWRDKPFIGASHIGRWVSPQHQTHTHTQIKYWFIFHFMSHRVFDASELKVRPHRQCCRQRFYRSNAHLIERFSLFASLAASDKSAPFKIFCNNGNIGCPFDTVFCTNKFYGLATGFTVCKFCHRRRRYTTFAMVCVRAFGEWRWQLHRADCWVHRLHRTHIGMEEWRRHTT